MPRLVVTTALTAATLLSAACLGSNGPAVNAAVHVVTVSGSDQTADVSSPLPAPLVAQVLDDGNRPIRGVAIVWRATGGGVLSAD
ncbi:MAG TPA: hypothetical protein VJ992_02470, partial [Gemmatimonadales bacterium]|nr:hypothetical protein [Gemmatimonadales bacterium]